MAPTVHIGNGLTVPQYLSHETTIDGATVHLLAVYDQSEGRYLVTRLTIDAADGQEITGTVIRTIRVAELLREAGHAIALPDPDGGWADSVDGRLRRVASIYRWAFLFGGAPVDAIVDQLGVPRGTASQWVTRARDQGFLTVIDRRAPTC